VIDWHDQFRVRVSRLRVKRNRAPKGKSITGSMQHLERHIADCAFCLGQVGFVVRSEELETPTEIPLDLVGRVRQLEGPQKGGGLTVAWNWRHVSTAAAAVALVGFVWLGVSGGPNLSQEPSRTLPTVRGMARDLQSPTLSFPQEGDVINPGAVELRWAAVPQAIFYRISIVTTDGDLVWEAQVEKTETQVPTDAGLAPGHQCFVWVEAHLKEGGTVTSPVVGFQIAPR